MKIIHNFGKKSIKKVIDDTSDKSLMLASGGSYLWIGSSPASRYQGWFFGFGENNIIKIVDSIHIGKAGEVVAAENNFWNAKIIRKNITETFWIFGGNCFGYETGISAEMEIFFDIKEPYQNPEYGRNYKTWRENGLIFINYFQDGDNGIPEIFIVVCGDISDIEMKNEWISRDYELDRKRGSEPWSRWIFVPAVVRASRIIFAAGFTKEEAVATAMAFWSDFEKNIKEKEKSIAARIGNFSIFSKPKIGGNQMVRICAQNSLTALLVRKHNSISLRAGLPWFFQIWQRDEAISLAGMSSFNYSAAQKIFWRQLDELKENNFHFDTADGIGWLFLCAADFYADRKFNFKEIAAINAPLQNSIDWLLKNNTQNNLAVVSAEKTWMDSLDRSGAGIEIQALRLNMYSLAADFAADKKQKAYYSGLEDNLKNDTRMLFFSGKSLADRFDVGNNKLDLTVRPNIFLAAYIYPDLLSKNEWVAVFENALEKLWLDWGGLSTIDKTDPRYCGRDTGENPAAYHNGDSWFWVNNIAAIVLSRVDKNRFKNYIEKIFEAGKNDILWNGAIGCASEISSAQRYEPAGCPNQAWSNATFLELCAELKI